METKMSKSTMRKRIRHDLKCPEAFLEHLERFNQIKPLCDAYNIGKAEGDDLLKEIKEAYRDFCEEHELNPKEDNRDFDAA